MAPAEPNHKPFQVQGELPTFDEEREGWKGYIEWERYPEKKKKAAEILAKYDFPVVSVSNRCICVTESSPVVASGVPI
jgi:sulfite oxidase